MTPSRAIPRDRAIRTVLLRITSRLTAPLWVGVTWIAMALVRLDGL
ncbi:hypothetical protein [Ponticoccus alexandrii]|uniref:Uncharacterized protein n=1 Tax=Ponticoccus alexandrii TaxID=1943633 RepID=A0ABX7F9F9_9RHOB|nr:hypothetical protein [Ponticoccus alexandrii]QRF66902.1 hypothetical protein GQA70_11620 [Ponticoccus alexandrii]